MEDLHEVLEAIGQEGQVLFQCQGCDEFFPQEELIEVRECSYGDCEQVFDGTETRNCESCNRPFTRVLTRKGCPNCIEGDSCSELDQKGLQELYNNYTPDDEEEGKELEGLLNEALAELERQAPPVFKSRTERIRYLAFSKGMSRSAIAEELGVKYQIVRSALVGNKK